MAYNDRTDPPVTLVAAVDKRMAIGKNGTIPWLRHLSSDMEHFKKLTTGELVVMGRKTYESLPPRFRPLPDRENWILTRNQGYDAPGCRSFYDADSLLFAASCRKMVYVIGGSEVYKLFLPYAQRIVLTHVETTIENPDAYFPPLKGNWLENIIQKQEPDGRNQFGFTIIEYLPEQEF